MMKIKLLLCLTVLAAMTGGMLSQAAADTLAINFNNSSDLADNFTTTCVVPTYNPDGYLTYSNNGASLMLFNQPTSADLTIQGDFSVSAMAGLDARGVGFLAGLSNSAATDGFLGIFRVYNNGIEFRLFTGASASSPGTLYNTVNFVNTTLLAANTFYTLSMQVVTIDDSHLNFVVSAYNGAVLLGTTTVNYTGLLAAGYDDGSYAGFRLGNGTSGSGSFDNFIITGVIPEPSTYALLGVGALLLAIGVRKRRCAKTV